MASGAESASGHAGLRLRLDALPSTRPALVDRDMRERIVLNLLPDALKYRLEGEIEVSLRDDADGFELRVRDTGVGIPAEQIPRIFERFHRITSGRIKVRRNNRLERTLKVRGESTSSPGASRSARRQSAARGLG